MFSVPSAPSKLCILLLTISVVDTITQVSSTTDTGHPIESCEQALENSSSATYTKSKGCACGRGAAKKRKIQPEGDPITTTSKAQK